MLMMLKQVKLNSFLILVSILLIISFMNTSVDFKVQLYVLGTMQCLRTVIGIILGKWRIVQKKRMP